MISSSHKAANLKLDLTYSRITIKPSHDDKFHLTAKREKEFSFDEQDTTLILNQKKRSVATYFVPILSWRLPTKAELEIPSEFTGSLTLTNKDGWAVFNRLNIADLEINNRNGKVVLADIKARSVNALARNGKTELHNIEAPAVTLTANNGKIILNNLKSKSVKAQSRNGKILPDDIAADTMQLESRNGKILPAGITCKDLQLESRNGKIKGNNITAKTIKADSRNGKIMLEDLNSDNITLDCNNGKVIAALAGEEKLYAMDIRTHNGKSIVAGKVTRGSFVYKDKEKAKQLSVFANNGNVILTFLNKN